MRTKYIILFIIILITTSCNKLPINGKLDGMWQLQKIDYVTEETNTPKAIYYSIQLNLIRLNQIHEGDLFGDKSDYYIGRFTQADDSLNIYDIRIYKNETIPATLEQLQPFGLNSTFEHFKVEKLTHETMVLRSNNATLYLRKF